MLKGYLHRARKNHAAAERLEVIFGGHLTAQIQQSLLASCYFRGWNVTLLVSFTPGTDTPFVEEAHGSLSEDDVETTSAACRHEACRQGNT